MSSDVVIRAEGLGKCYHIYDKPQDRLKQSFLWGRRQLYRDFWALKDLSVEIERGESLAIIGKNGSGKSTLLQLICGVLNPTEGLIEVDGRIAALLELGAGFNPEFTGIENVFMNAAIIGLKRKEIEARLDDILAFADIGDFVDQPVKTYSSGMYVRLAFATAINVSPEILVVDEALSVGDIFFQAKCMTKIRRMMDDGVTILFVTHSMDSVKSLCKNALFLKDGTMAAYGGASDITDLYVKGFRDEMNVKIEGDTELDIETCDAVAEPEEISTDRSDGEPAGTFSVNTDFMKRMEEFRYGTGEVRITDLLLLDKDGAPVNELEYDAEVAVRMSLCFKVDATVNIAYHVRDEMGIKLLMGSVYLEKGEMFLGHAGEGYVAEFKTRFPMCDGSYSISASVNMPTGAFEEYKTIDLIDNAWVFKVLVRRPLKVWSKIYCKNELSIRRASENMDTTEGFGDVRLSQEK